MNNAFKQFYANLYRSELPEEPTKTDEFLSNIQLPEPRQEEQMNLNQPFTYKEIGKSPEKSNKSPDEERFPPEFYREIKEFTYFSFYGCTKLGI